MLRKRSCHNLEEPLFACQTSAYGIHKVNWVVQIITQRFSIEVGQSLEYLKPEIHILEFFSSSFLLLARDAAEAGATINKLCSFLWRTGTARIKTKMVQ